ncbi:MAG: alpha/beta fold hydrolase [Anaerolineaceae bacterium]|nr:MAG: alpha/beta fold hydrolase [Anaerolineaceae bacterium]
MLNYRMDGEGPPLLLLHGFGISFNIWTELTPRLRGHFKMVTVELPGIGLSPLPPLSEPYLAAAVDALDSLRDSLAIPRWRVLSYSSGTRVAEAYLQSRPERVERAIFLAPAYTSKHKAFGLRVASMIDERFPQLGNWVLSGWRIRFLIRLLGFNLRRDPHVPAWFDEITSQPVNVLKATLRSLPEFGARPFAVPPEIPSIFIWGREDLITATPRHPSARHVLIHATHAAPQTSPCEVGEVVLGFLQ